MTQLSAPDQAEAPDAIPYGWLTPRPARESPIHRWFVFPHSFSPELVRHLFRELGIGSDETILDPFCGAGTTLVEAQRLGAAAIGLDLLPLAVLASRAKTRRPSSRALAAAIAAAVQAAKSARPAQPRKGLLARAFTPAGYGRLSAAMSACPSGPAGDAARLAILSSALQMSCLRADGGWLRLRERALDPRRFPTALAKHGARMLEDLPSGGEAPVMVYRRDARRTALEDGSINAVVTSPPYPNRHDYTRIFAVELELGFGLGDEIKVLRKETLHSHPEGRSKQLAGDYLEPAQLTEAIEEVERSHPDPRIPRMIRGYFRDLHDVLVELHRILKPRGQAALVVGNARYCGTDVPVDTFLAMLATSCGFQDVVVAPVRMRGNSAQQMGRFGRKPARESIVTFRR